MTFLLERSQNVDVDYNNSAGITFKQFRIAKICVPNLKKPEKIKMSRFDNVLCTRGLKINNL